MKILWICGLPRQVQRDVLNDEDFGSYADWSWILGHLPPPPDVELHIACRTSPHTKAREFDYQGARFHLVPVKARARVYFLYQFDWRYFRKVMARVAPDVVHGWGTEDAYAWVATSLSPERHVVEIQGNLTEYRKRIRMPWPSGLGAYSERMALKRARCLLAENEYSLQAALPMAHPALAQAVEHPIRREFLTSTPTAGEQPGIVFVGAIDERKGIWQALDAFEKSAPLEWRFDIVGGGHPDNIDRLQRRIGSAPLSGRVRHHPSLSAAEIIRLMQSSSVFLLPTWIDTGPTALKEGLAMGLWPVCYDNSGPGFYLRRFETGDLAKDLDPESLATVLGRALRDKRWRDPAHVAKVGSLIRPHFDRTRIWGGLAEFYRQVANRRSSAGAST